MAVVPKDLKQEDWAVQAVWRGTIGNSSVIPVSTLRKACAGIARSTFIRLNFDH
jgi:hypothetical protein